MTANGEVFVFLECVRRFVGRSQSVRLTLYAFRFEGEGREGT